MADALKFVGDFRTATSDLLTAIDKMDVLSQFAVDLGWDQATFANITGDLSGAEFWAAVAEWRMVNVAIEASITALAKLKA